MSLSYAPTRQFSAAIVILREAFRVYSHISRERPGNWSRCGALNPEPIAYKAIALPLRYIGVSAPSCQPTLHSQFQRIGRGAVYAMPPNVISRPLLDAARGRRGW